MFYFVSIKLRNTEEKLFLTGPQHFSSQFCTRIFVLGLCGDLVLNTNDRRLQTFSDGGNRNGLSSYFSGVESNPTPQCYRGEPPKPGFPDVCIGVIETTTSVLHTFIDTKENLYAITVVIA